MKIITTLAEHEYFLGFAALLNSFAAFGPYADKVIVGYRKELPDWLPELTPSKFGHSFTASTGPEIEFVQLNGNLHMVHEKPKWFIHVTEVLAPEGTEYFFFDSDIVINERMSFFGEWVREGIAVCGDINYFFERRHPIRKKWATLAQDAGYVIRNDIDNYYNSGFLGWTQETKSFLHDWINAFEVLAPHSGNMQKFRVFDRTATVLSTNQDSLNLAMMITDQPLALFGPEAMGFIYGLQLMHHPIGAKPWNRNFIRDFFVGHPPRQADVAFWNHINGKELSPVGRTRRVIMHRMCQLLRFKGRIYKAI